MGFHNGTYATVWSVEDKGNYTKVQLSTSSKNRETGDYETDWSDYANFVGGAHKLAQSTGLKKQDRIKIIGGDEKNRFDKDNKRKYYNHVVFEFEVINNGGGSSRKELSSESVSSASGAEDDPF